MVRVTQVEVLDGFRAHLVFTDGVSKTIDLRPFLNGPMFEPLKRDRRLFEAVAVDAELGTIVWPNGADICPDVLRWDRVPAALSRENSRRSHR